MKEIDLKSLFEPKSIAVIGASNTEGKVGDILMEKLKLFKGKVIPINKKNPVIHNLQAYKKVTDYKNKIDLAVIATPKKTVLKILKNCGKKKIKNIIIISSGFSEQGNIKTEKKIFKLKNKYQMNILGPNCFGIIDTGKNLDLTFSKVTPKKGNIAFISQSGALGSYIIDLGIKFSGFVSVGNMLDLDFADFIKYFENDPQTKKIVIYLESLKHGKKFINICKKSKKEIVVVKAGKTDKGKIATMSHTGSLATDTEIYSGAFKQARIKEMNSLLHAFDLKQENIIEKIKGKKVAIITNAGGAGALLTDKLSRKNYKIYGPIDLLGTATSTEYKQALDKLAGRYDSIVVIITPQTMTDLEKIAQTISTSRWKYKILACFLGEKSVKEAIEILKENDVHYLIRGI
jgi:acyl-CoA synthetase (NDP forming)